VIKLTKAERRGGSARREAIERARRTRTRVEREITDRRGKVDFSIAENRRKAEHRLRDAESALRRNREAAERRAREAIDRVTSLV
jgi:hypothetical protein